VSRLVLGTRGSALALAQTQLVRAALAAAEPGVETEIREFKTTGDKRQDLSLSSAVHGDAGEHIEKGLFTKELELALVAREIDVAIHSLKDLPTANPPGLTVAAVLPRANPGDVLIFKTSAADYRQSVPLMAGSTVATSSVRRQLQLQHARPDLKVVDVRGNVGTRLEKLRDRFEWAALVLARAGLERLGFALDKGVLEISGAQFGVRTLGSEIMLPAVGQGAIALQTRDDDTFTRDTLAAVNHAETFAAITAERELLRLLGGGCQAPLGVATSFRSGELTLRAVFHRSAGELPRIGVASGREPREVAAAVAAQLLSPHA
jgi:hydroxymethylbilane synthase